MKDRKKILIVIVMCFCIIIAIFSFVNSNRTIVNEVFIDSLINNTKLSAYENLTNGDLEFWEKRHKSNPESNANSKKYASALSARFHLYGDINDLKKADSLLNNLNIENKQTDAGILRALATNDLLNHRFNEANMHINNALSIGSEKYASQLQAFDVAFELGKYQIASSLLLTLKKGNEYGYFFRLAKYQHWEGT
jgi:hypothetical protein